MLVELEKRPELSISTLRETEQVDQAAQDSQIKEMPQSKFLEFYGTIHETWNTSSTVALYGMNKSGLHHYWTMKMVREKDGIRILRWRPKINDKTNAGLESVTSTDPVSLNSWKG
jgi:hypothetical protein